MAANSNKPAQGVTFEPLPSEKTPVDPMAVITTDEHAGQGGSFMLDPATGARTKVVAED